MKKALVTGLVLASFIFAAGCNLIGASGKTQDESSPDFNHGYSISVKSEKGMREIRRSDDIVHDADEALKYLQDSFKYPDKIYTYVLTDTSDDDPGAYMWYKFTVLYENIPVENSDFTVIAFTDGTIVEGRIEFFRCTQADRINLLSKEDALDTYLKNSGDTRNYVYLDEHYYFSGVAGENPYIYIYRYDCGDILENTTLYLNAQTGEMVGMRPDAID